MPDKRATFFWLNEIKADVVKLKHFSPLVPQNKNVCIKDLKSKYAYVFCDEKWQVVSRTRLVDEIYIDVCNYIEEKLKELINELNEDIVISIKRFIEKKDYENVVCNIKFELEILLFNKRHT